VTMPSDPLALLRSRGYLALLVLAAIIGAPVSAVAYFFLALVSKMQGWVFTDLPKGLGFHAEPLWWPLLPLAVAGILVALTLRYLPGTGGHSSADGFKTGGGPAAPIELPGIVLAAFATLSLGVVLGPEAPLIGPASATTSVRRLSGGSVRDGDSDAAGPHPGGDPVSGRGMDGPAGPQHGHEPYRADRLVPV
jgi:H+/Cl- antiporter ClcA